MTIKTIASRIGGLEKMGWEPVPCKTGGMPKNIYSLQKWQFFNSIALIYTII